MSVGGVGKEKVALHGSARKAAALVPREVGEHTDLAHGHRKAGGGVVLASGVAAGGYVVGGFAGAASNLASGVKEVQAANKLDKIKKSGKLIENGDQNTSAHSAQSA